MAVSWGTCDRASGVGIRVSAWSLDGGANNSVSTSTIIVVPVVMNSNHVLKFYTVTQHELTLDYGATLALTSVTPASINGDSYGYDSNTIVSYVGDSYLGSLRVVGWSWDNGSINLVPITANTFAASPVLMNESHVLHVDLETMQTENCVETGACSSAMGSVYLQSNAPYPVQFEVDGQYYPGPVSFVWPVGSNHTIGVPPGQESNSTRSIFVGWVGSVNSTSNVISVISGSDVKLLADYDTQYLVHFVFTDARGNPITADNVSLVGGSQTIPVGSNLSAWLSSGAPYLVHNVLWEGMPVAPINSPATIQVTGPTTVTVPLSVYPETVQVDDPLGLPMSGVAVSVSSSYGFHEIVTSNSSGYAAFEVPNGVYSASVAFLGLSYSSLQGTPGSHSMGIQVMLDYPVILILGGLTTSGPLIFMAIRRRDGRRTPHDLLRG